MKKALIIIYVLVSNLFVFGQEKEVSNYKYIIVPELFAFLKQNDQYQTSSLTKFLLKKNGFTVVLDSEEYPLELKKDACKALTSFIIDKSSMFKTAVLIEFKNCSKKVVYRTKEGDSKLKDYKKGFQEAIRAAHAHMSAIQYVPLSNSEVVSEDIEKLGDAVVSVTNKKRETVTTAEDLSINNASREVHTLYAQPNENGFQLINTKPEVIFLIMKTNIKEVFILKNKNGLLYKKGATWFAEFYENDKLIEKKYQIKF
jgi:hypothetical protein